eukprot:SAG11_NODE_7482_length_1138_cov_1.179981_1_plen_100_part_00
MLQTGAHCMGCSALCKATPSAERISSPYVEPGLHNALWAGRFRQRSARALFAIFTGSAARWPVHTTRTYVRPHQPSGLNFRGAACKRGAASPRTFAHIT